MSGVNRILWVVMWLVGCHVGRPPVRTPSVTLGAIEGVAVQPGLPDALRQGLSDALAAKGMLGRQGPSVSLKLRDASTRAQAADGGTQVYTARLEIEVAVGPPDVRSIVLVGERNYGVQAGAALDAASARSNTFGALAQELTEQAAAWIRYAPVQESK